MKINFKSVIYDEKYILKEGTLDIIPGVLAVVSGESGSGKTTLFQAVLFNNNWLQSLEWNNHKITFETDNSKREFIYNHLSSMEQNPLFLCDYNIGFHIQLSQTLYHCHYSVDELIDKLDIEPLLKKYPSQLSGGERTRVAFLLCIIKDTDIYILDEPTSGLDKYYIDVVYEILKDLMVREKYIIVFSHDRQLINNADILYRIHNQELRCLETKEFYQTTNNVKNTNKKTKEITQLLKHETKKRSKFQMILSLIITFSIGFSAFSSCFNNFVASAQNNQINELSSRELRVAKPTDEMKIDNLFGTNKVLGEEEINDIKKIKNVEYLEWRFDSFFPSNYCEDITLSSDMYEAAEIIKVKEGGEIINEIESSGINFYSYVPGREEQKTIKVKFHEEGLYLSATFAQLLTDDIMNLENCALTFKLPIPIYNTFGRIQVGLRGEMELVSSNAHTVVLKEVTLPIAGVLQGESFGVTNYASEGTLYIDRNIIEKYIDEYRPTMDRTLYVMNQECTEYYLNACPIEEQSNIDRTFIDTIWSPTVYSVYVDQLKNIDLVIEELQDMGYVVESEYFESSGYLKATEFSQQAMITAAVIVASIIIAVVFIIEYNNKEDIYEVRRYFYLQGYNKKELYRLEKSLYLLNTIKRVVFSLVPFSLLVIISNEYFGGGTGFSILAIVIIIVLSIIVESIIPILVGKRVKL